MRDFTNLALFFVIFFTACGQEKPKQRQSAKTASQTVRNNIAVGKGPDALFLTPDEDYLYVANVGDTFISVIATGTDRVVQTIDGTDYPWGFTRLGETNLVAVSGYDKGVDLIDFTTHKIVKPKRYEQNLGGIASTKDGKTLFVVATGANKVLKIDANSLEILDDYDTGNGPDGVGISKDDSKIYVTNTKDGTISVINLNTKKAEVIKTGGKPELIHYNHDHSLLYISNFVENKIHILDTGTDKIVHEITGLDGPEEAVLSESGKMLYVVNFNSSKVFSYDAKTYEKLPQEFSVGTKPIGVVSAANDSKLYVSNYGDNAVSAIQVPSSSPKISEQSGKTSPLEILVKFKPGVEESQVKAMESEIGLKQVKAIPELNLRVFKIASGKSLQQVLEACQKMPFVEYAEPNQTYRTQK
ncbi:MAG: YncE family protein [bacterium]